MRSTEQHLAGTYLERVVDPDILVAVNAVSRGRINEHRLAVPKKVGSGFLLFYMREAGMTCLPWISDPAKVQASIQGRNYDRPDGQHWIAAEELARQHSAYNLSFSQNPRPGEGITNHAWRFHVWPENGAEGAKTIMSIAKDEQLPLAPHVDPYYRAKLGVLVAATLPENVFENHRIYTPQGLITAGLFIDNEDLYAD